jgi:hypothetical protein
VRGDEGSAVLREVAARRRKADVIAGRVTAARSARDEEDSRTELTATQEVGARGGDGSTTLLPGRRRESGGRRREARRGGQRYCAVQIRSCLQDKPAGSEGSARLYRPLRCLCFFCFFLFFIGVHHRAEALPKFY